MVKNFIYFSLLVFLLPVANASVKSDEWICTHKDSANRIIQILRETQAAAPCSVVYTKNSSKKTLWTAKKDAAFCNKKAVELENKLINSGWRCEKILSVTVNAESTDLLPKDESAASILKDDSTAPKPKVEPAKSMHVDESTDSTPKDESTAPKFKVETAKSMPIDESTDSMPNNEPADSLSKLESAELLSKGKTMHCSIDTGIYEEKDRIYTLEEVNTDEPLYIFGGYGKPDYYLYHRNDGSWDIDICVMQISNNVHCENDKIKTYNIKKITGFGYVIETDTKGRIYILEDKTLVANYSHNFTGIGLCE